MAGGRWRERGPWRMNWEWRRERKKGIAIMEEEMVGSGGKEEERR